MTWANMLSWWQWLALGTVPPAIVLLYFLKLKREPLEVPSTFLWHRSIEDLHVNSIWQRLRQSLLLFLQLLLIALAMLAVLRPGWHGSKLVGHRFIFLIDNSASMSATDVSPSRLDEAKRQIRERIDEMQSGDVAMLVSFSDSARVEQPFTDNRRELRRRLDAVRQTNRSTSLSEALRVSAGLANPGRAAFETSDTRVAESLPATLYIFSDGKFPDVEGFSLGNLTPIYVPIGQPQCENVAITAFNTQRPEGKLDQLQAFARLENFGARDVTADLELYLNGTLADANRVPLKAHGAGAVAFDLGDIHEGTLKLVARPGGALKLDDEAWTAVNPPRRGRVLLVSPGNDALELGLQIAEEVAEVTVKRPDFLQAKEYQQQAAGNAYDLVIYDQCRPREMPQANTLFVGRLPPLATWSAGAKAAAPQVIDVNSAHPLMQLIELGNVQFAEGLPLKPPTGGTVLIDTNVGVLFAIAAREGFEDAVLGAEIVGVNDQGEKYANTDWPLRLSFPEFLLNVLKYLGGNHEVVSTGSVPPGTTVALRSLTPTDRLSLRTPAGQTADVRRGKLSTFNFSGTDATGIYEVREAGQVAQRFAVNLFNSSESDVRPRPQLQLGAVEVQGQTDWEGARQETWKGLLLLALGVLLLEWYIYNRRVYL